MSFSQSMKNFAFSLGIYNWCPLAHTDLTDAAGGTKQIASSVGNCVDDTFIVTCTTKGSPVNCSENTKAHSRVWSKKTTKMFCRNVQN